ncbi:MAG: LysR family transcriptional regulator [Alphaproteobacteria bacterium]|nr:LysR family transcriptional regulator [Alphaproteobacteria bacterium]
MLYTQIRAFDAVARAGSFVRAADLLGLSQPAVSAQVRALETTYGVKLFQRSGRTIQLTASGKELLELTRRFITLEDQMRETLTSGRELGMGSLKIAFDGPHIAIPLVVRFRAEHPRIDLVVSMGNTRSVRQQLLDREVDLAVLPRIERERRVHARPLKRHHAVVIVSTRHAWAGRRSIAVRDLAGQPMVAREAGSNTQRCVDEGLSQAGVSPHTVLRLGSREAVKEAVASDLGFAIVWDEEARGENRLHAMRLTGADITSTDYLACLKDNLHRRSVAAFFKLAEENG